MVEKNSIAKHAFLNALGATLYVALVAAFMSNIQKLIGPAKDGPLSAMSFLMVFVLSAAIMGTLIFGRPLLWYFDGNKKQAILLAINTIGIFAIFTIGVLLALSLLI